MFRPRLLSLPTVEEELFLFVFLETYVLETLIFSFFPPIFWDERISKTILPLEEAGQKTQALKRWRLGARERNEESCLLFFGICMIRRPSSVRPPWRFTFFFTDRIDHNALISIIFVLRP